MLEFSYIDFLKCVSKNEMECFLEEHEQLLQAVLHGEEKYSDSLGWLNPDEWAGKDKILEIEAIAGEIRSKADAFVLVGVGGSNNAARSVVEALQKKVTPEIVYMGNTLSPYVLDKTLQKLRGKNIYVNCIAKNFETLEPGASFRLLRTLLRQRYGADYAKNIIATGTPGSSLEKICDENGYGFLTFPPNIGGRFSALSNVGLLPMAVAGINIRALAEGARKMRSHLISVNPYENPALRYACLRNLLYRKGYKLEMLSCFEPQFRWFFKWWIQLFAESEGKEGKGLFPVASEYSEELHSVGQFVQDGEPLMFETFLDVREQNVSVVPVEDDVIDNFDYLNGKDFWEINKASFNATLTAHSKKLPCLTITVERVDEAEFGGLFYFFELACYLSGRILGINPFDQPGVEAYKAWMFKALGK